MCLCESVYLVTVYESACVYDFVCELVCAFICPFAREIFVFEQFLVECAKCVIQASHPNSTCYCFFEICTSPECTYLMKC
jgi:hypothetical protein